MAGQQYGLPAYLQNNTQGLDSLRLQAQYQQQGYNLDFPSPIKYQPHPSKEDSTRWRNMRHESPTKRQKVEETPSEVKFVSQTKWKFPESQKWIEVQQTPSTQARNAARASREAENIAILQARQKENRGNGHSRNVSETQTIKFGNAEELKEAQSAAVNSRTRSSIQENTFKHTPNPLSEAQAFQLPANTSHHQQQTSLGTNTLTHQSYGESPVQQIYPVSKITTIVNGIEIGPTHVAPKSVSLSDRALSLEKDADRIAALIAEKRRTNEATMFRQKMLQKQMEHQSERSCNNQGTGTMKDDIAESTGIVLRSISEEAIEQDQIRPHNTSLSPQPQPNEINIDRLAKSFTGSRDSRINACTDPENGFEGWSAGPQIVHNPSSGTTQLPRGPGLGQSKTYHNQGSSIHVRKAQIHVADRHNGQKRPQNQQATRPTTGHLVNSTTMTVASSLPGSKLDFQHRGYGQNTIQTSPIDMSAHTLAVQSGPPASDQVNVSDQNLLQRSLPGSSIAINRGSANNAPPQHEVLTQVSGMYRSGSGSTSRESNSANNTQYTCPSQQFQYTMGLERNLSSQNTQANLNTSYIAPSLWQSRFPQHQMSLPTQPQTTNPTFYSINQNFYLGHNEITQPQYNNNFPAVQSNTYPVMRTPVNDALPIAKNTVHSQGQSTFAASQQQMSPVPRDLPQPPILGSNMNMFSGQARASSTYGQKSEPPKRERANMFTSRNTATNTSLGGGMIMGMEDVRRQIEMT